MVTREPDRPLSAGCSAGPVNFTTAELYHQRGHDRVEPLHYRYPSPSVINVEAFRLTREALKGRQVGHFPPRHSVRYA